MEQVYDSKNKEHEFSVGDWVFLKLQPYGQMSLVARKNYKFSPQIYGSFQISKRIGKIAYRFDFLFSTTSGVPCLSSQEEDWGRVYGVQRFSNFE